MGKSYGLIFLFLIFLIFFLTVLYISFFSWFLCCIHIFFFGVSLSLFLPSFSYYYVSSSLFPLYNSIILNFLNFLLYSSLYYLDFSNLFTSSNLPLSLFVIIRISLISLGEYMTINLGFQWVIQSHDRAFSLTWNTACIISWSVIDFMIISVSMLYSDFSDDLSSFPYLTWEYSFIHSCSTASFAYLPIIISPFFVLYI